MLGSKSTIYGDTDVKYLKLKGLKEGNPYFEISEKVEGGNVEPTGQTETVVSGDLVEFGEMKNPNYPDKFHGYMILQDMTAGSKGESYRINFGMTNVMRNVLNNLAGSEEPLTDVRIALYTDKQGYAKAFVTVNNEKVEWKWSWEELQKLVVKNKVKKGGKTVIDPDYFEVDKLLMTEGRKAIEANIVGFSENETEKEPVVAEAEGDDDLPF